MSLATGQNQSGPPAKLKPAHEQHGQPPFAACRARSSGIGELVYCLSHDWHGCKYASNCAFNTFCLHPANAVIVARTEAD